MGDVDAIFGRTEFTPPQGFHPNRPVMDVGEGIRVATVIDPFGNEIGVIENPNFKLQDVR